VFFTRAHRRATPGWAGESGEYAEPNVVMTRTEGPVPRRKNASISRTWWTGRLLTRPGASLLGALSSVSPATSRSRSHSLCSDRSAASPAAKPTRPLTPHSSMSGKRRAPSSSPPSSTTPWARAAPAQVQTVPNAHSRSSAVEPVGDRLRGDGLLEQSAIRGEETPKTRSLERALRS